MKASFLLAVCLASVLVAGCTAASHQTPASTGSFPAPNAPRVQTFVFPLAESVAAGNRSAMPASTQFGPDGGDAVNGGPVTVDTNATAILVEARVACASPTCRHYVEWG